MATASPERLTPRQASVAIARAKLKGEDLTEPYRDLGFARLVKVARENIARNFPPPSEDQRQVIAEILLGGSEK